MTETDLITAGSSENAELPNTVSSDNSSPAEAGASVSTPAAETAPTIRRRVGVVARRRCRHSCCPELRALAKEIGVEGASGMRKSDLVAAIKERRGQSNGRAREAAGDATTSGRRRHRI